jgi:hypothetical protein
MQNARSYKKLQILKLVLQILQVKALSLLQKTPKFLLRNLGG